MESELTLPFFRAVRLGAAALLAFSLTGCIVIPSGHRHYRPYAGEAQPVYVPPVRVIQRYEHRDRYEDRYDPDPAGPRRGWR